MERAIDVRLKNREDSSYRRDRTEAICPETNITMELQTFMQDDRR